MEAGSQTPGDQGTPEAEGQTPEQQAAAAGAAPEGQDQHGQALASGVAGSEADPTAAGAPAEGDGGAEGEAGGPTDAPVPTASDEERLSDLSEEERNPAVEQSPAATAAQDAVVGDPGLRDEQQPVGSVPNPDTPVRTSAPPPSAQSGVPLPEDRAAGVQPGVSGPAVAGGAGVDEEETPDHDGSEGQSSTSPMGS
jgi:hypothetical protein